MSRLTVPALVTAFAAMIGTTSCSPGASPEGGQSGKSESSASVSATATHFQRLGYDFAVPPGWTAQEGYLDWPVTGGSPPRLGAPTFDDLLSPASDPRILIGKQPVPD